MKMCISSAVDSACHLVRYPSITPDDCGCLEDLSKELARMGFQTDLVVFGQTTNLFARRGNQGPHLCFAGHVDVVPPGPSDLWESDPFNPVVRNGSLYGRGIADMKGAIACFLSALYEYVQNTSHERGSISLLLTSDEEGLGADGVPKMIPWMKERNHIPDLILIGEPTGSKAGSVLQIGRRGSLLGAVTIQGKQGHIAYPDLSDNPVKRLHACLGALLVMNKDFMDRGDENFEPSYLAVSSVGTPDLAENVTPGQAWIRFGVRFNPLQSAQGLENEIQKRCHANAGPLAEVSFRLSGLPFFVKDERWIQSFVQSIKSATGEEPQLTTRGGTTDGRFLHALAPVLELGLSEETIHQVNEHVVLEDLDRLKRCYFHILLDFFHNTLSASI